MPKTELPDQLVAYVPEQRHSDAAVIIFPGGAYSHLAAHEGEPYARQLNAWGVTAFVMSYRVAPHRFPAPLQDARNAVRFVRSHAAEYGIDPQKILVMGSSAGGHLAALVSTYRGVLPGEEHEGEDYRPNGQILCYPVICSPQSGDICHRGSYQNLLGTVESQACSAYDPSLLADAETPPAFLWHTAADTGVSVVNSYRYATVLREHGVSSELHVFPDGYHGLGVAEKYPHVAQWLSLLQQWLIYQKFIG